MLYLSLIFTVLLIFAVLILILLSPAATPDFRLKAPCGNKELESAIVDLALKCRFAVKEGTGLPVKIISRKILEAYSVIGKKRATGYSSEEFERVFYDNYAQISSLLFSIKSNCRKFYALPHIWGLPRVYFLCELIVKLSGGYVTEESFSKYVRLFSESCPLLYSEITCLYDVFSYAVAEYITIVASAAVKINDFCGKGKADAKKERVNVGLLKSAAYLKALYEEGGDKLKIQLKKLCYDNGIELKDRIDGLYASFDRYNVFISSAVKTLFERQKWMKEEFLLSLYSVNDYFASARELRFYENTLSTRRLYLEAVSKISLKTGKSETAVAAEAASRAIAENCDVGKYLLKKEQGKTADALAIFLEVLIAAVLSGLVAFIVPFPKIATAVLSVPLTFVCSHLITSFFFSVVASPRTLPYKDIKYIPEENGANIVYKAVIASEKDAKDAVYELKCLAFLNPERHFSYTLYALVSLGVKNEKHADSLVKFIEKEFAALSGDRYNLFVQKPVYSADKADFYSNSDNADAEYNLFRMISEGSSRFCKVMGNTYRKKYLITADKDMVFNCGKELLEIMEHPLNGKKNFVAMSSKCTPQNSESSFFARLFSLKSGQGFYFGSEGVGMKSVCDGSQTGIYRVKEFYKTMSKFKEQGEKSERIFPLAQTLNVTFCKEKVYAPFPADTEQYIFENSLRIKRFLLLSGQRKRNKSVKTTSRISFLTKWRAFLNVIYSLSPLFSLSLIVVSMFSPYSSIVVAVALLPYLAEFLLIVPSLSLSVKNALLSWAAIFTEICLLPVAAAFNVATFLSLLFGLSRRKKHSMISARKTGAERNEAIVLALIISALAIFTVNIFYGKYVAPFAVSALFLFAVPLQSFLSEKKRTRKISPALNGYLLLTAAKTWNYFAESCVKENNFFPPDMYCELGDKGFCKTTSPASVGMAIVAAFSAKQLKIINSVRAAEFIAPIVKSICRLEKYKGNFYSSYELNSLRVIPPHYVSSLENGIIFCALMLAQSFADDITKAAIDEIVKDFDFKALYDENSGFVYKGIYVSEKQTDSVADFFASEELLYCLAGIGKGDIPRSAFYALSRDRVRCKYKTVYSLTGGASEYLLAPLFFNYHKGTFCDSVARGAVSAQLDYAVKEKLPYWGLSQSLCLVFDEKDEYRSGRFGVKQISYLQNDGDKAISPYSCLLALKYAPRETEANIAAMIENKLLGRYGFYDAVEKNGVVRAFTAYHQGLSLGAICNFMCEDSILEAMSSTANIRAAEVLLYSHEKIGKSYAKFKSFNNGISAPAPVKAEGFFEYPLLGLYGTNNYKFVVDENGRGFSVSGNYYLTKKRRDDGFNIYASAGGETFDLTEKSNACFYSDYAEFNSSFPLFKSRVCARALVSVAGEMRTVTIKNLSDKTVKALIGAYVPVKLDKKYFVSEDEGAADISVKTEIKDGFAFAFRDNDSPCIAHYACGGEDVRYYTSEKEFCDIFKPCSKTGLMDPVLGSTAEITLSSGEEKSVSFAVFASSRHSVAKRQFDIVSSNGFFAREETFSGGKKAVDKVTASMASRLIYGSVGIYKDAALKNFVNTDFPTVVVNVENDRAISRAERELNRCATLYSYGIKFNVVVCYRSSKEFEFNFSSELNSAVSRSEIKRVLPLDCVFRLFNVLKETDIAEKLQAADCCSDVVNPVLKNSLIVNKRQLPNAEMAPPKLILKTAKGGFTEDGSYFIDVSECPCEKPWRNFVGNDGFGTVMTDSGGGYTFSMDAKTHKITSDSLSFSPDCPSESVFLGEGGTIWSVTRAPIKKNCNYFVLHSFGYTKYSCNFNGLKSCLTEFIGQTGVKYYSVEIRNEADYERKINAALVLDVALGSGENTSCSLIGFREDNKVTMKNTSDGTYCTVECSQKLKSFSFSRKSMMNKRLEYVKINELEEMKGSSVVYSVSVPIKAKSTQKIVFCLSAGAEAHPELADEIFESVKKKYSSVSPVSLQSGDKSLDMLYKWLPYQVYCSRFFRRYGYDAYGATDAFRDKLETALGLMYFDCASARKLILECVGYQFERGDVLNFLDNTGAGLRTRRYDDRLFLPIAVADYIAFSGDCEILSERVAYLADMPLPDFKATVYGKTAVTASTGSVLEHCKKALFSTETDYLNRVLFKGGDEDLSLRTEGKEGISVYGTMLYYHAIKKFLPFVTFPDEKEKLNVLLIELSAAAENQWDGEWYRRAEFKGGVCLGGNSCSEYKIDLKTQAIAVLSGAVSQERADFALRSAERILVNGKNSMPVSFMPPLNKYGSVFEAGKYPSGVRDNGAQNAYASVMFTKALYKTGRHNRAYEFLNALNPINLSLTQSDMETYKSEPFSFARNVTIGGEGDLSWYASYAGCMYRCITEYMLGMTFKGDTLTFRPRLSDKTDGLNVRVRKGKCDINIYVDNSVKEGEWRFSVGGVTYNTDTIRLFPSLNGKNITISRQK